CFALRSLVAKAAFCFHALISIATGAEWIVIVGIPHQLRIAFVREFVTGDSGSDDLTTMTREGITAEVVATQEAARVSVPARVITSGSGTRAFLAMSVAMLRVRSFAATGRSAGMFGLEHLIAALLSPRVRAKQLRQPTACFLWALTVGDKGPPGLAAPINLHGLCEIVAHLFAAPTRRRKNLRPMAAPGLCR